MKKTDKPATLPGPQPAGAVTANNLPVAYHDGPPSIGYCGRDWQRGVPQPVPPDLWVVMKARSDFAAFDFRIEPETPADKE